MRLGSWGDLEKILPHTWTNNMQSCMQQHAFWFITVVRIKLSYNDSFLIEIIDFLWILDCCLTSVTSSSASMVWCIGVIFKIIIPCMNLELLNEGEWKGVMEDGVDSELTFYVLSSAWGFWHQGTFYRTLGCVSTLWSLFLMMEKISSSLMSQIQTSPILSRNSPLPLL